MHPCCTALYLVRVENDYLYHNVSKCDVNICSMEQRCSSTPSEQLGHVEQLRAAHDAVSRVQSFLCCVYVYANVTSLQVASKTAQFLRTILAHYSCALVLCTILVHYSCAIFLGTLFLRTICARYSCAYFHDGCINHSQT